MGDIKGAAPPWDRLCSQGGAQSRCLTNPRPSQGTSSKPLCLLPLQNQIPPQRPRLIWEERLAHTSTGQTTGFWPITD